MFEALTEKLTAVFSKLGGKGRITEGDVDEALREVRLALLEADVNFRVARDLLKQVRERAVGTDVLRSVTPAQQVVKIVHEELTAVLSAGDHRLRPHPSPPSTILLVGLQGSGKTTTASKLALHLRRHGQRSLLVAADLRRPAAVDQLVTLGRQLDIPVYHEGVDSSAVQVATSGLRRARELGCMWAIVDTGGRLHIDQELMEELSALRQALEPAEVLLVVDAMAGQDAVNAAQEFHQKAGVTGLILSKLDGDARGGAALSISRVTGVPVKFAGMGERPDALEPFYPDRMASRILGMGDVVSLVEKAQEEITQERAKELERKMRKAQFNLEDFLEQLHSLRRMGPLQQLLEMLPGFGALKSRLPADAMDERRMKRIEAIIYSMTPQERRNPEVISGSRRRRIAAGSGTTPQDINQLLNQFREAQRLMKQLASGKGRGLTGMPR
ncbi:MAG: signal recognition particle protein [Chloroflexi bacterium]|nr:signal recognition particle protein [Chloroflexota bacterium]